MYKIRQYLFLSSLVIFQIGFDIYKAIEQYDFFK
jgi:hypothetical protein